MRKINTGFAWKLLVFVALVASGATFAFVYLPEWLGGPLIRARRAYARREWGRAETEVRAALKENPRDDEGRRLLARSIARLGRDGEAVAIYRGLGMEKLGAEDLTLLAAGMTKQGQSELAQDALESARKLDPAHVETLLALVKLYADDDSLTDALEAAEQLRAVPGQEARGSVEVAKLYEALDDPEAARAAWEAAMRIDSRLEEASVKPEEARMRRARLALRTGRPDETLRLLKHDDSRDAAFLASRAHLQKGESKPAAERLAQAGGAATIDPLATEPSPYVGSAKCGECHEAIAAVQTKSRHAKTFHRATDLDGLNLAGAEVPDADRKGVVHAFHRRPDGRVEMKTKTRDDLYTCLVDFAFGSGDRGVTLVGHDQDGYGRELRMSHYGEQNIWDRTFGQAADPADPKDLVGRYLSRDAVRRCVGCHVTRPGVGIDLSGPEVADGAIGCERCHGPGLHHVRAVELDFPDLSVARPKAVVGEGIVNLCGGCHKPKGENISRDIPAVVRFQAATLTWSKCYKQSFGKLDCVTCHDPHRNATTSMDFYEVRCLACHAPKGDARAAKLGRREPDDRMARTVCKVNPDKGCVGCHMPIDAKSIVHSPFTSHEIRIEPPNARSAK